MAVFRSRVAQFVTQLLFNLDGHSIRCILKTTTEVLKQPLILYSVIKHKKISTPMENSDSRLVDPASSERVQNRVILAPPDRH